MSAQVTAVSKIPRAKHSNGSGRNAATNDTAVETIYQHSLAAAVNELAAKGARRLLVTSCEPGEGKSSVTADLGLALARSGRDSVMLVDADQFKPTLHRGLGLPPARGLGDLLDEVYLLDIMQENPDQFGIGDWLEILRAQRRSGALTIQEGSNECSVHVLKGTICSITDGGADGVWLGEALVRAGRITTIQKDEALHIHEETGRPLDDVLKTVGFIEGTGIDAVVQDQAGQSIRRLIAFQRPECRFSEHADKHLPAAGGRPPAAVVESDGIDQLMNGRLRDYLRDPFLASQVPSYFSDTAQPNLKVLTGGTRTCDLQAPRFATPFKLMLDRLARAFDIVLIDAPPVSMTTAASALAAHVDGVLFVVKSDGAEVNSIRRAIEQLRRAGGNVLGVVLNQVDVAREMTLSPYYRVLVGPR